MFEEQLLLLQQASIKLSYVGAHSNA